MERSSSATMTGSDPDGSVHRAFVRARFLAPISFFQPQRSPSRGGNQFRHWPTGPADIFNPACILKAEQAKLPASLCSMAGSSGLRLYARMSAVAACLIAAGVQAQTTPGLFHVSHDTYACQNPRATLALTNPAEPRRTDPGWVAYVVNDGHCAPVTPRSPWNLVSRDGELAYISYAGTTGLPGSFYFKNTDLVQLPCSPQVSRLNPAADSAASWSDAFAQPAQSDRQSDALQPPSPMPDPAWNDGPDLSSPTQPPGGRCAGADVPGRFSKPTQRLYRRA